MRVVRSAILVSLLAAAALTIAACGGGVSKDQYERQMRTVGSDISKASAEVAKLKPDASPAQREQTINRQATLLSAAADKAADIDAPRDARDAHKEFVDALRDYVVILHKLAKASGAQGTSEQQAALLGEAGEPIKRLDAASARLAKAGYTFKARRGDA